MEIKVGEYIRTKSGIIAKITKIDTNNHYYFDKVVLDNFAELSEKGMQLLLKKHSFVLAKLAEEGDYVNGLEVVTIDGYDEDGNDKQELGILETYVDEVDGIYLTDVNIKSIVTKEQFKAMEYEVKYE